MTLVALAALPLSLLARPGEGTIAPREAHAAVSILMSMNELLASSTYVVVGTAGDRYSVWEDLPGGRRIVTYTRVKLERSLVGSPGSEVLVRTLGGVVGSIGQAVAGDAKIASGERALLFLTKNASTGGALVVAGLAQGHFPITVDAKGRTALTASPDAGTLVPRTGPVISAREALVGRSLEEASLIVDRAHRAQRAGDGR